MFLTLAGYPADAATLSATALNQPDRTGSYSADEAQKDSIAALMNAIANQTAYEQALENAATLDFADALQERLRAQTLRFKAWRSSRHAAALFADTQVLLNRLRPYAPLDVHIPEWIEPELVRIMGEGVIAGLLEQARAAGAFSLNEGYYFAYQAEIAALRGDPEQTLAYAARALGQLPAQESLLRTRLSARIAEAAWQQGDYEIARRNYELALQNDPSLLRRLGLSLPVRIRGVDDPFVRQVIDYLEASPRLHSHGEGLSLEVFPQNDLTICLSTLGGSPLSCVQMGAIDETLTLTPAQQLVQEFHAQTFGLGYDISQAQRMRLMGSSVILSSQGNTAAQQNRDAVLQAPPGTGP
jgi:tetratricopeptide (TPR) repeat protein